METREGYTKNVMVTYSAMTSIGWSSDEELN